MRVSTIVALTMPMFLAVGCGGSSSKDGATGGAATATRAPDPFESKAGPAGRASAGAGWAPEAPAMPVTKER